MGLLLLSCLKSCIFYNVIVNRNKTEASFNCIGRGENHKSPRWEAKGGGSHGQGPGRRCPSRRQNRDFVTERRITMRRTLYLIFHTSRGQPLKVWIGGVKKGLRWKDAAPAAVSILPLLDLQGKAVTDVEAVLAETDAVKCTAAEA